MKRWLRHLIHDKGGQDLAEYALLLGLIAMLMVVTLASLGYSVNLKFGDASTRMSGALTPGGGGQGGSPAAPVVARPVAAARTPAARSGGSGGGASGGTGGSDSGAGSGGSAGDDDGDSGRFDPPKP